MRSACVRAVLAADLPPTCQERLKVPAPSRSVDIKSALSAAVAAVTASPPSPPPTPSRVAMSAGMEDPAAAAKRAALHDLTNKGAMRHERGRQCVRESMLCRDVQAWWTACFRFYTQNLVTPGCSSHTRSDTQTETLPIPTVEFRSR